MKTELEIYQSASAAAVENITNTGLAFQKAKHAAFEKDGGAEIDYPLWERHFNEVHGKAISLAMNPSPSAIEAKKN